jgi:hypothetical protein
MTESTSQRLLYGGAGIGLLLALGAWLGGGIVAPEVVRWSLLAGGLAIATIFFVAAAMLSADGDAPIEWLDSRAEEPLAAGAPHVAWGAARAIGGWVMLVVAGLACGVLGFLISAGVIGANGIKDRPGVLWVTGLAAVVGFVLPFFFLRPHRSS